jgi:hypothetical protein
MQLRNSSTIVRTRLATLSPGAAIGLLFGLLILIGVGLALPPLSKPGGSARGGDALLYQRIAARVATGEGYYEAMAAEHRASDYPLKPFTAVRQPLLAETAATLGPGGADLLMRLLAVVAVVGTVMRLAPRLRPPFREVAILLSATSAGAFVQAGMWVWHDIWAGLLVALALACRTRRRWGASVLLGLLAAAVRELAFPFLLVMGAAAWWDGNRREALAWFAAAATASALLALHAIHVQAIVRPGDPTSPGWLTLGGWRFDLALARQTSLLLALPAWITAIVTPLALLGWSAWRGAYASRVIAMLGLWMTSFLVIGRPDNSYWGFLFAPLLPVGLALAPAALLDLVRAASPALRPVAARIVTR